MFGTFMYRIENARGCNLPGANDDELEFEAQSEGFTPVYYKICERSLGTYADKLFLGDLRREDATFTKRFSAAQECYVRAVLILYVFPVIFVELPTV